MAMGDIAFNLLIFFVILARAQDDGHVKWIPPTSPDTEAGPTNANAQARVWRDPNRCLRRGGGGDSRAAEDPGTDTLSCAHGTEYLHR